MDIRLKRAYGPAGPADGYRVLIAGGGVGGLETLLALRALAPDRLDITSLAPDLKFVKRSMSAQQPFKVQRARGLRLDDAAAELGAHWHRGALERVVHAQHRVVTRDRESLGYDMLVLALGARPQREWHAEGVLTYCGGRDGPNYRMLLHQLREGRVQRVAFVRPAGASWPLPLYDLALMTSKTGEAADVMPQDAGAIHVDPPSPQSRARAAVSASSQTYRRARKTRALADAKEVVAALRPRAPKRRHDLERTRILISSSLRDEPHARQLSPRQVDRDRASAPCRPVEPGMSASEAPIRRLLFVADAAVAEVHDLPPEARALLRGAAGVYVVTPTLPGRLAWLADDMDQFRHLADDLEKRVGTPLLSYAVDSHGHATGAQHP